MDLRHHGRAVTSAKLHGHQPLRLPLAGIMHQNRHQVALRLALGEPVWLRRDPTNEFDRNAISVKTQAAESFGYIGRNVAVKLAPYIDANGGALEAVVTELVSDIPAVAVGVAVSLYLPSGLVAEIAAQTRAWDFYCDVGPEDVVYLFLNCDEAELERILDALQVNGLHCVRSGLSYRPAADRVQYRWYVRLEGAASEDTLRRILHDTLGPRRSHTDASVDEYIATFEPENVALRRENEALKSRVAELQNPTRSASQPRHGIRDQEVGEIIQCLLPNVRFLRRSLLVIIQELESCDPALRELRRLSAAAGEMRAKRVHRAPAWKELTFSTGHNDDGRLYFKQAGDMWVVLVSFKASQERDFDYLAEH